MLGNLYFWIVDYIYVGYWQVRDLLSKWDPKGYEIKHENDSRPSIVLIPGVYESWKFMRPLAKLLYEEGYDVRVIEELKYNKGSVEDMARIIDDFLHRMDIKKSILIAHSKGGLIGKYLLSNHNKEGYIKGLIGINVPFAGSKYAYLLPLKTVRVFLPDSPLLTSLALNEKVNRQIVSIYGIFDPHIPVGSYLKGARNIQLRTHGHFRILGKRTVHDAVIEAVRSFL
jgi:triacylglycerol lipase